MRRHFRTACAVLAVMPGGAAWPLRPLSSSSAVRTPGSRAASVCRTLVLLKDGEVLAAGATADVLTPALIRDLYGVEADVSRHPGSGRLVVIPMRRVGAGPGR